MLVSCSISAFGRCFVDGCVVFLAGGEEEEEEVQAAPSTTAPTGGTAELEAELLDSPGPTGLPPHAEEGALGATADVNTSSC